MHSIHNSDYPVIYAMFEYMYIFKDATSLNVPNIPTAAGPPNYGFGNYANFVALQSHPFEVDSSFIPWAAPGYHTISTPNTLITRGMDTEIHVYSDATSVTINVWPHGELNRYINLPANPLATWTAPVADGVAIFELAGNEILIGRYELVANGNLGSRSVFIQAIDIHTALRTGATRHTVDSFIMFGLSSRIVNAENLTLHTLTNDVEINLPISTVESSVAAPNGGWLFRYGAGPRVQANQPTESQFDSFIMRGLQMQALPGFTFEIAFDSRLVHDGHWQAYHPTPISWNASAEVQNIGPHPHWPPRGALFSNGNTSNIAGIGTVINRPAYREDDFPMNAQGQRPTRPATTSNFNVGISYHFEGLATGQLGNLIITFSEPVSTRDFGIGFDFSQEFTLDWNNNATQLTVKFASFTRNFVDGDELNLYFVRLRDLDESVYYYATRSAQFTDGAGPQRVKITTGNAIASPIGQTFIIGYENTN